MLQVARPIFHIPEKSRLDRRLLVFTDVLSAAAVYIGTSMLRLDISQFVVGSVVLTTTWIGVAMLLLNPSVVLPRIVFRHETGM